MHVAAVAHVCNFIDSCFACSIVRLIITQRMSLYCFPHQIFPHLTQVHRSFLNAPICIAICSTYATLLQTNELVKTQAYQQGNTKEALVQVFLRMDEMLSQESVQDELQALAGPKTHTDEEEE